jgi:hypothetical protein
LKETAGLENNFGHFQHFSATILTYFDILTILDISNGHAKYAPNTTSTNNYLFLRFCWVCDCPTLTYRFNDWEHDAPFSRRRSGGP